MKSRAHAKPSNTIKQVPDRRGVQLSPPRYGIALVDGGHAGPQVVQARLRVGQPDDEYERQADRVADQILRMPETAAPPPSLPGHGPAISATQAVQRKCSACEDEEALLQRDGEGPAPAARDAGAAVDRVRASGGQPLAGEVRAYFEPRFARDFSDVRIHTGAAAVDAARDLRARAFTVGRDVAFAAGEYQPHTPAGRHLLAHELTHVVQQGGGGPTAAGEVAQASPDRVQRKLASPRFVNDTTLEDVEKGTTTLQSGSKGRAVLLIQHALYDIGFVTPQYGADGDFGSETTDAVKAFQKSVGEPDSGKVDKATLVALDARFKAPALPSSVDRAAKWTEACVLDVLCPWSPHTVNTLKTITVKSFDKIQWDDEEWDGSKWIPAPFPGGGYQDPGAREIGLLNDTCESVAETLYHETLHANQPTTQTTMYDKEFYAYRIGEEFSIALGLGGRPGLRSKVSGHEQADVKKISKFVKAEYPSVSSGGASAEEIVGKGAKLGDVKVKDGGGKITERPAVKGEKVPGPIKLTNPKTHDTSKWKC
jgi:hypothetical protein